jgi:hypothetical protein
VAVATNLDTGATNCQVIPGPAFLDADGALVRATGPWAFLFTVEGDVINAWGHITFDEQGSSSACVVGRSRSAARSADG